MSLKDTTREEVIKYRAKKVIDRISTKCTVAKNAEGINYTESSSQLRFVSIYIRDASSFVGLHPDLSDNVSHCA